MKTRTEKEKHEMTDTVREREREREQYFNEEKTKGIKAFISNRKKADYEKSSLSFMSIKGITLVALVVTIVVLLILAGVTINLVLSDEGIFKKAEQAEQKHNQAKARESLELVLSKAQIQKYEGKLTDEELNNQINKIGELLPREDESSNNQQVIVDGYIFEIDRSVPKIIEEIGPADGIIITAKVTQNEDWINPIVTVTGSIKKYGEGTVKSSSAIATNEVTIPENFPTEGGNYTIANITKDTDITITATDSNEKKVEKTIEVRIKKDTSKPVISEAKATPAGMKIKMTVKAEDTESGIKQIKYKVEPGTVTPITEVEGRITSGEEKEIETTTEGKYTITYTAEDNVGNTATATVEAETVDGGVIKHIKIKDEGLREVNTKNIYGAEILGYTCQRTNAKWQLFYIDEEDEHRVYLIAKDYMAPPVKNATVKLLAGGAAKFPKAYRFGTSNTDTSILEKFAGIIPSNDFTRKFLSDYAGTSTGQQANLQATNYMLDQTIWAEYMSMNEQSDYAFGGPTLPLFKASYNDICKIATKMDYQKNGTGYQVNIGGDSFSNAKDGYGDTNTQKGMYFYGNDLNLAMGMWLASPSSANLSYVMNVAYYRTHIK